MLPYSQNPHLINDLAQERYKDLRREADAWRLSRIAQDRLEASCVPADSALKRALMTLRLRLAGTPRRQIVVCP